MRRLNINIGDKFNRLTIVKEVSKISIHRAFKCECDCGNTNIVRLNDLRNGHTKSCGCYAIELLKHRSSMQKHSLTHGLSNSRIYRIWHGMKTRCYNKNRHEYKYYGGRGISYEPKWESFEGFYEDMKEGYEEYLTLDRINNNGNYRKDNCKWVTRKEQSRNTRKNVYYKGKCISEWCEELGLKKTTVLGRINRSNRSFKEAL